MVASRVLTGLSTVLVLASVASCGGGTQGATGDLRDGGEGTGRASVSGLQVDLSLEELVAASDLIVVGTPIEDEVRPFSAKPRREEQLARRAGIGAYHDVQVEVHEYLKGASPEEISVQRRAASPESSSAAGGEQSNTSGDAPAPAVGEEQIFFLFEGRGPWAGGYLLLGEQGIGQESGDVVTTRSGDRFTLAELRAIVEREGR